MNKKIVLAFILITTFGMTSMAQVKTGKITPPANNLHLKVFNTAMLSGDINAASLALNYYLTETGDNSPYADTLAVLYMQSGLFAQCYYWTEKRLKIHPDDSQLLEMKGICLDKFQQTKEAIEVFEKLFAKTQSPYHGYKLMELQYDIKRLGECIATANATEKLSFKPEYTMTYSFGQQNGRTYLQAGVFNLHALALYALDKKDDAKVFFEKALALDSGFVLAKENLRTLTSLKTISPVEKTEVKSGSTTTPTANKQD